MAGMHFADFLSLLRSQDFKNSDLGLDHGMDFSGFDRDDPVAYSTHATFINSVRMGQSVQIHVGDRMIRLQLNFHFFVLKRMRLDFCDLIFRQAQFLCKTQHMFEWRFLGMKGAPVARTLVGGVRFFMGRSMRIFFAPATFFFAFVRVAIAGRGV